MICADQIGTMDVAKISTPGMLVSWTTIQKQFMSISSSQKMLWAWPKQEHGHFLDILLIEIFAVNKFSYSIYTTDKSAKEIKEKKIRHVD